MGDPKQHRKKYTTPSHPWQGARIQEENALRKVYGTKNKKEIWKMNTVLKDFTFQAKKLIAEKTPQSEKEKQLLLGKLIRLGLIKPNSKIEDVLNLKLKDVMDRRLQTQIMRKGFASSARQARQYITHGHIIIGDKKLTSPSHLLSTEEESKLNFAPRSTLNDPMHPERAIMQEKMRPKMEVKAEAKKEAKAEVKETKKHETKSSAAKAAGLPSKTQEGKPAEVENKVEEVKAQ